MRLLPIPTSILVILSLLLTIMFVGCTKTEETKPASSKSEPTQTTQPTPSKASALNAPGLTSNAAPAAAAIASGDGERTGTRVDVTELKRSSDNTLTLKFVMVNDSDARLGFGYDFGDKEHQIKDNGSIGAITLVDSAGKKKYFVVRDSEDNCLCSRGVNDIAAGSRTNLWAKFPAPPDDVQKISIVIPHFGPIDDVPISH